MTVKPDYTPKPDYAPWRAVISILVPPSRVFSSLMWAVLLPGLVIPGAGIAEWVTWAGVVVVLAAASPAAVSTCGNSIVSASPKR
ncbi:hypothetical protein ACFWOJ_21720 [Streptomyces sp. NPDC058439]|uniref:hypothetical protein n=1 Tax=Streptomyces sp. NPDC058439 TaxID=3346500 RepID=UPI003657B944